MDHKEEFLIIFLITIILAGSLFAAITGLATYREVNALKVYVQHSLAGASEGGTSLEAICPPTSGDDLPPTTAELFDLAQEFANFLNTSGFAESIGTVFVADDGIGTDLSGLEVQGSNPTVLSNQQPEGSGGDPVFTLGGDIDELVDDYLNSGEQTLEDAVREYFENKDEDEDEDEDEGSGSEESSDPIGDAINEVAEELESQESESFNPEAANEAEVDEYLSNTDENTDEAGDDDDIPDEGGGGFWGLFGEISDIMESLFNPLVSGISCGDNEIKVTFGMGEEGQPSTVTITLGTPKK